MISVIIPCYNSQDYVSKAIESVLSQTYTDYEIILVDNNSTDHTMTKLQEYANKFPGKIRVLREYKKGAPAARNKGLSEALGEWIQFLDSDDELLAEKMLTQLDKAETEAADIIIGGCRLQKSVDGKTEVKLREVETKDVWKGLITSKLGITSANLWKKAAVLDAGGWNEEKTSSQEYDLLFRLLRKSYRFAFCPDAQTTVHVRPNSVHKTFNEDRLIEILENNINLRLRIKDHLRSAELLTKDRGFVIDGYIYTYLLNTTNIYPFLHKKGKIPEYVRSKLKESELKLPLSFIVKFHLNRLKTKLKNKLS